MCNLHKRYSLVSYENMRSGKTHIEVAIQYK